MTEYIFVAFFGLIAVVIVVGILVLSSILGPRRPTRTKVLPYECGMIPSEEAKGRYPVRFASIAMLFIIFDIEVVFMYPWAVALGELKMFGFVEMLIFMLILGIAYIYVWGRGGLEWD
tara:strand:- start:262 stop:615 length:354 start_codon:yes stop_codon:yes gene_type:complete